MKIVVTGGLGFIGSHLVNELSKSEDVRVWDAHTYAAEPDYIGENRWRYVDVTSVRDVRAAMAQTKPDVIFHLAAESHVCRSIDGPRRFIETNVMGTFNMLEAARELVPNCRIIHVSTDEVFGEAQGSSRFTESTPYAPRSPYAASKAASDHLARSYAETYGMDIVVTNCTNNFGPYQNEEKLIPRTILALLTGKDIIVHGKGDHVRDWIWVKDHVDALVTIANIGAANQYLIGGECEMTNLEVVHMCIDAVSQEALLNHLPLIKHTNDRPTDDARYAVDPSLTRLLGWSPKPNLMMERIRETVRWYANSIGAV